VVTSLKTLVLPQSSFVVPDPPDVDGDVDGEFVVPRIGADAAGSTLSLRGQFSSCYRGLERRSCPGVHATETP
jgi:hypothetical protein